MVGTMIINRTPTAAGGGSLIGADRHHRRVYMQGVGRLHGTMHASNAGCTARRGPDVAADHWTGSWWHRCAASSAWFGGTGVQLFLPGSVGFNTADDFNQTSKSVLAADFETK